MFNSVIFLYLNFKLVFSLLSLKIFNTRYTLYTKIISYKYIHIFIHKILYFKWTFIQTYTPVHKLSYLFKYSPPYKALTVTVISDASNNNNNNYG